MGKMLPVPAINGLDELLDLVREDNKITKYLNQMKTLNDSIVENLDAYEQHNDLDKREREAKLMLADAESMMARAKAEQEKNFKSIALKRKNLKTLETDVLKVEKRQKDHAKKLEEATVEHNVRVINHSAKIAFDAKAECATEQRLQEREDVLNILETELKDKFEILKEMFG